MQALEITAKNIRIYLLDAVDLKQPWLYLCRCIVTPEPERAQLFTPNPKFLCIIALLGFYQLFSNFVQETAGQS